MDQRHIAGQDGAHDADILARLAQRLAVGLAVPALHHLGAGEAQPQQHAAAGELVQGDGGHGRVGRGAAGHLHDGRAQVDALRPRAQPGQGGDRVRAVGLGRPDGVEAQAVGLLDQVDRQSNLCAGVADVEAEAEEGHGWGLLGMGNWEELLGTVGQAQDDSRSVEFARILGFVCHCSIATAPSDVNASSRPQRLITKGRKTSPTRKSRAP